MEYRKLGDFLKENTIKCDIDNETEYKCGGVRLNGRGVFTREIKLGSDIQKQWVMHRVKKNNVVYSTLFADKGAFAIATEDDEELIFSEKFVSFDITDNDILPEYLYVIFQTDYLSSQCNELKTGMAAFSLSHTSKRKVQKLSIPVPSVEKQKEVIEQYKSYDNCVARLDDLVTILDEAVPTLKDKFSEEKLSTLSSIALSELGEYVNESIDIIPGQEYKQVTVRLHGNGLVLRKLEDGANIKTKQSVVRKNNLVFSKIDVKSGAIGFVPEELDGAVVTSDFPVIEMKGISEIDKEFLMIYFSSDAFCKSIEEISKGTTNRVRTKKSVFLKTQVPWGTKDERQRIVEEYRALCEGTDSLAGNIEGIKTDIPIITSKYLNKLLGI